MKHNSQCPLDYRFRANPEFKYPEDRFAAQAAKDKVEEIFSPFAFKSKKELENMNPQARKQYALEEFFKFSKIFVKYNDLEGYSILMECMPQPFTCTEYWREIGPVAQRMHWEMFNQMQHWLEVSFMLHEALKLEEWANGQQPANKK